MLRSRAQAASPLYFFDFEADFNEEPFRMGSFREIVRSRLGPAGRISEFSLGLGHKTGRQPKRNVSITFREQGSQPVVARLRYERDGAYIELQRESADTVQLVTPRGEAALP